MQKSLLLVLAFMFVFGLSATAQNNCVAVRGLAQEVLLDPAHPAYPWSGPVQLILGDNAVLQGTVL